MADQDEQTADEQAEEEPTEEEPTEDDQAEHMATMAPGDRIACILARLELARAGTIDRHLEALVEELETPD